MAESDSAEESAMAESQNLMSKARDLLATPSHKGLASLVDQIFRPQETDEYRTARTMYDFCVSQFPNCLTLMLLKVYRDSSNDVVVRFRSILLLSEALTELRNRGGSELSLVALHYIKPLLISCLTMPKATKSDTKILRIIVSSVAYSDLMLGNCKWDELSGCILSLANTDPLRAFNFFLDSPLGLYGEFIDLFQEILLKEVYNILLNPQKDRAEDWILALETAVKLGILGSETRSGMTKDILGNVLETGDKLVRNGMEQFLERGLEALEQFLAQDMNLCIYSTAQCSFLAEFAFKISGIGTHSKVAAEKIYQLLRKQEKYVDNHAFKLSPSLIEKKESDRELYNNLKVLSPADILSYVALTKMDDSSRDIAMRRLHDLLCDHTFRRAEINASEIRKLKPLLLSCLGEEGLPENTLKILGQVVFHVAHEMFSNEEDWFELWDYIASGSVEEFDNMVYIFQCLTMMLEDKDFVIPAINSLVPEIIRRLINPPMELLVDNSGWVLAFTGGFCAAIHLIDVGSHAGVVKEIAYKMINSVRELVERRMEVGIVRRGFRDMESIVKKQVDWYDTCNYKFVKGLLWRLYAIEGLRMESKMVLWRTSVILEREVQEEVKVFPKTDFDWLNQ